MTLSDATSGAAIYYTIDGSTPTVSSFKYAAPIAVVSTMTLKAIAQAPGAMLCPVTIASYTITQNSGSSSGGGGGGGAPAPVLLGVLAVAAALRRRNAVISKTV